MAALVRNTRVDNCGIDDCDASAILYSDNRLKGVAAQAPLIVYSIQQVIQQLAANNHRCTFITTPNEQKSLRVVFQFQPHLKVSTSRHRSYEQYRTSMATLWRLID